MVIYPLMPKGVEHYGEPDVRMYGEPVIYPLMPKGVEHFGIRGAWYTGSLVIYPLMPKGVEHDAKGRTSESLSV